MHNDEIKPKIRSTNYNNRGNQHILKNTSDLFNKPLPESAVGREPMAVAIPEPNPSALPVPNIIIFGETGTGKSSVINMIAGEDIAGTSSQACGYTFGSIPYDVIIDGKSYRLWDTAGLSEGDRGTVPADIAMSNLRDLVHNITRTGGVNLLIYCIRGARFREIIFFNYHLFRDIICLQKVPVVLVATGLEYQSPMSSWWTENKAEFKVQGLEFKDVDVACITSIKGKRMASGSFMFEDEFIESTESVRELIRRKCISIPCTIGGDEWLEGVNSAMRNYRNLYKLRLPHTTEQNRERANRISGDGNNDAGYQEAAQPIALDFVIALLGGLFNMFRPARPIGRGARRPR